MLNSHTVKLGSTVSEYNMLPSTFATANELANMFHGKPHERVASPFVLFDAEVYAPTYEVFYTVNHGGLVVHVGHKAQADNSPLEQRFKEEVLANHEITTDDLIAPDVRFVFNDDLEVIGINKKHGNYAQNKLTSTELLSLFEQTRLPIASHCILYEIDEFRGALALATIRTTGHNANDRVGFCTASTPMRHVTDTVLPQVVFQTLPAIAQQRVKIGAGKGGLEAALWLELMTYQPKVAEQLMELIGTTNLTSDFMNKLNGAIA